MSSIVLGCYTNITNNELKYITTNTDVIIPTTTTTCNIQTNTRIVHKDSCGDIIYNQGYKCRTLTFTETSSICETITTNIVSKTRTIIPTYFPKTFMYKLNCDNKSYSSLISVL